MLRIDSVNLVVAFFKKVGSNHNTGLKSVGDSKFFLGRIHLFEDTWSVKWENFACFFANLLSDEENIVRKIIVHCLFFKQDLQI